MLASIILGLVFSSVGSLATDITFYTDSPDCNGAQGTMCSGIAEHTCCASNGLYTSCSATNPAGTINGYSQASGNACGNMLGQALFCYSVAADQSQVGGCDWQSQSGKREVVQKSSVCQQPDRYWKKIDNKIYTIPMNSTEWEVYQTLTEGKDDFLVVHADSVRDSIRWTEAVRLIGRRMDDWAEN